MSDRGKSVKSLGNCCPEDVAWLSSLSESELDLLVCIKNLVIQRAMVIDGENLVQKFDLRMLRAIGAVLIEYVRDRLKGSSLLSYADVSCIFNHCNLTLDCGDANMGTEDILLLGGKCPTREI